MKKQLLRGLAVFAIAGLSVIGVSGCSVMTLFDGLSADRASTDAAQDGSEQGDEGNSPQGGSAQDGAAQDDAPKDGSVQDGSEASDAPTPDANAQATESLPDGAPADFPAIGVPFYQPATLVATPSAGDPWVLEFVTDHELTIVNSFIENNMTADNGWQNVTREVNGQTTVTKGQSSGYELVVAVAPEQMNDNQTSIYYTVHRE